MNPANNLILVGPMGAGKSGTAVCLAGELGLRAVDLDQEIEREAGASVAGIFEREGEAGFRRREQAMLATLLRSDGLLLATGGGAVLVPHNRRLLRARGFVVHLHVAPERQLERLAGDRTRPLLQHPDPGSRLAELAAERAPLYAEVADLVVDTAALDLEATAGVLRVRLRTCWQRGDVA